MTDGEAPCFASARSLASTSLVQTLTPLESSAACAVSVPILGDGVGPMRVKKDIQPFDRSTAEPASVSRANRVRCACGKAWRKTRAGAREGTWHSEGK